jgi:predicted nucleic acid-binding protein
LIEPVQIYFQWRPQLVDPADEMVLETAINGQADAIATHNVRHFSQPGKQFRVEVLSPGELMRKLRL